jgi:hypothetical protein
MKHLVSFEDSKGNQLMVSLKLDNNPFSFAGGSWRTLRSGGICHSEGYIQIHDTAPDESAPPAVFKKPDFDVAFCVNGSYGIRLIKFISYLTANDSGVGFVAQPWVLGFQPGRFKWTNL